MKDFYVSKSDADNIKIATELLPDTVSLTRTSAMIFGLSGDLGSGKTTWTKGLVTALGGDPNQVTSPTFVLMRDYDLGENIYGLKTIHHLDVYRLKSAKELSALKLDQEFNDPTKLFVIEWWENVKSALPKNNSFAKLSFETINDYTRTVSII